VTRYRWKWSPLWSYGVLILFLSFDLPFLTANSMKILDGGWIPLFVGFFFYVVMWIWKMGRSLLGRHFMLTSIPMDDFLSNLGEFVKYRIPGTGVFMASTSSGVPPVLMRMVNRFLSLHETVILLTVTSENVPFYCYQKPEEDRVEVFMLSHGFHRVIARYGFMESHDIPRCMEIAIEKLALKTRPTEVLYVLRHETFVEYNTGQMSRTKQAIFSFLSRNARNATDYFGLPPGQVIELGTQIDL